MREIAEAAGMSMGQLYHYISSKDDVLFLIHKHMQTSWYKRLTDARIEECENPVRRLEMALHASLNYLYENKKLIQFIYTESKYLNEKHLKVVLEMDNTNVSGYWRELVKETFEQENIPMDYQMAGNMISYNMVFVSMRGWNIKNKSKQEILEFVVDFIFNALTLTRPRPQQDQTQT